MAGNSQCNFERQPKINRLNASVPIKHGRTKVKSTLPQHCTDRRSFEACMMLVAKPAALAELPQ
jgi:hypothetical protein